MTPLEAVLLYITRFGFHPVPIPLRAKAPVIDRWQQLEITAANADAYFNGDPMNVGVRLGDPWNLTDIDLDTREVLWAWQEFALETYYSFGHRSKPASHHFFFPDEAIRSRRYVDPAAKTGVKACLMEIRSRKSDGSFGLQTVVPPSIHESGETIEFAGGFAGEPGKVETSELQEACDLTAAAALLGRYAPAEGARHEFFLALAGGLAHARRPYDQARRVVRAVYRVLWGPKADLARAEKETDSSYRRYDDGGEITGLPHLNGMLDGRVYGKAMEWLGLKGSREAPPPVRNGQPKRAFAPPRCYTIAELRAEAPDPPRQLVEDLLPRKGLTMIYGDSKAGKTLFSVQAAIAVATGKALLDFYRIQRKGAVMIIEQDDPDGKASIRQILDAAQISSDVPIHVVPKVTENFYIGADFTSWLEERIKTLGLVVIILDSYTALRAAHPPAVDIVKFESQQLTMLDDLGKRADCLIVLLHHVSHGGAQRSWSAAGAGTFGMTQASESQLLINRFEVLDIAARERLVRLQGRHMKSRELALRFHEDQLSYSLLLDGAGSSLYPDLMALQRFGTMPFNYQQAAEALGVAKSTVFTRLRPLVGAGVVIHNIKSENYQLSVFAGKKDESA